jgi:hypothetical protein
VKKVALLTTFFETTSGYSLIAVAETQINMLLDHGYNPVVLVQENFSEPEGPSVWRKAIVDLRPVVPFLHLESGVHDDFEARVDAVYEGLVEGLEDVEVCITHDIILQDWYKEHNIAMRRYAKTRPDLLWLHWIHSCPSPAGPQEYPHDCRYTPPPGYIVYPNDSDKNRVCQTYGLEGMEWRVKANRSGHSIDPLALWPYHGLTKDLVEQSDLLSGEITCVYPARLDRGKQPEKIVRLMAGVQRANYEPRLLVVDWQSSGERFQRYMDELLALSATLGLGGKINFTSRLDDRCNQGVPRQVVMELMDLSNVYVHPSRVETYSLVVHEAALRGCLLVLNHDFPPMRELFGRNAIYMDFGSDRANRQYLDEQEFWDGEALRLISELRENRAAWVKTVARREWTPKAMFKDFEPMLYLMPVGE